MGGRVRALSGDDDGADIVPLGIEKQEDPPPPRRAHSTLHTLAISGMSVSALVGICVLFLSIGIIPSSGRRVAVVVVVGAAVVFLACASTAVFTAARETYPARGSGGGGAD